MIPFLPEDMSFLKLTFKPIAAIAIVKTTLPMYSIEAINSVESGINEVKMEIMKKPIKYQGSLM